MNHCHTKFKKKKKRSRIPIVEETVIPERKRRYRFNKSGQIANTCICKHRGITENSFSEKKTLICMCLFLCPFLPETKHLRLTLTKNLRDKAHSSSELLSLISKFITLKIPTKRGVHSSTFYNACQLFKKFHFYLLTI